MLFIPKCWVHQRFQLLFCPKSSKFCRLGWGATCAILRVRISWFGASGWIPKRPNVWWTPLGNALVAPATRSRTSSNWNHCPRQASKAMSNALSQLAEGCGSQWCWCCRRNIVLMITHIIFLKHTHNNFSTNIRVCPSHLKIKYLEIPIDRT